MHCLQCRDRAICFPVSLCLPDIAIVALTPIAPYHSTRGRKGPSVRGGLRPAAGAQVLFPVQASSSALERCGT